MPKSNVKNAQKVQWTQDHQLFHLLWELMCMHNDTKFWVLMVCAKSLCCISGMGVILFFFVFSGLTHQNCQNLHLSPKVLRGLKRCWMFVWSKTQVANKPFLADVNGYFRIEFLKKNVCYGSAIKSLFYSKINTIRKKLCDLFYSV